MECIIHTGLSHKDMEVTIYSDISCKEKLGYCVLIQMKERLFCKMGFLPYIPHPWAAEIAAYVIGIRLVPQHYAITLNYDINDLPDLVFNPTSVPYLKTCQPYIAQLQQLVMERPIILERVPPKDFHYKFCHTAARLQTRKDIPINIEMIR